MDHYYISLSPTLITYTELKNAVMYLSSLSDEVETVGRVSSLSLPEEIKALCENGLEKLRSYSPSTRPAVLSDYVVFVLA